MLKAFFQPTKQNALGWALALGVVGAWQMYEKRHYLDPVDDRLAYNQAIIDKNSAKKEE